MEREKEIETRQWFKVTENSSRENPKREGVRVTVKEPGRVVVECRLSDDTED